MKIGIIGPNKIYDQDVNARKQLINTVAQILADSGHEIILTPDKDSLLEYFGQKYLELDGKQISLVIPTNETGHEDYLNTKIGTVISCNDWDRQADEFSRQCEMFICIGYAWGAMKEIACAQYFNNKKIYIIKEFVSAELPTELNFLVEYIGIEDLNNRI